MTLKRFREAFQTSRCKDDAGDATWLAHLVHEQHRRLTPWALRFLPTHQNTLSVPESLGLATLEDHLLKGESVDLLISVLMPDRSAE
jgi:hypothetical protein